jgi:DNA-binding transcriptional regulator YhcF (GntR family)
MSASGEGLLMDGTTPQHSPSHPALSSGASKDRSRGMSYKFQRLREKLRAAVASGELAGKLPGERALAKRFHVNAKTLSKALTDLAAEGVLDRSIGRGTFVKGSAPSPTTTGRWLVLTDDGASATTSRLVDLLKQANPDLHAAAAAGVSEMRPSFLNQFSAVVDLSDRTPESFVRDLVVRNLPVVAVGREPRGYSVHSVLIDEALGVSRAARDLLLAGHRKLAAVEPLGQSTVAQSARPAARRFAADATVDACSPEDVATLLEHGVTGFICHAPQSALAARAALAAAGADVPARASLVAVGGICDSANDDDAPCTGYFVDCRRLADAVIQLLKDAPAAARPATLWLAGDAFDRGTTGIGAAPLDGGAPAAATRQLGASMA